MVKELSVIIVVWGMQREAPRTIGSFLAPYQTLEADEIIVVDNGSPTPLALPGPPPRVRSVYLDDAPPSPAHAVNVGVNAAGGRYVCIVIDGARLVSPGLLRAGLEACRMSPNPLVSSVAFHLGHEIQQVSSLKGYGPAEEDALLASIGWPADGYRLFEIACFAASNPAGWFSDFTESNCLLLRRDFFQALGGMDDRFALPGGGLVNLDFFRRAVLTPGTNFTVLLGEGNFHQIHGGIVSNPGIDPGKRRYSWEELAADYARIVGRPFASPGRAPVLFGIPHPASFALLAKGADMAARLLSAHVTSATLPENGRRAGG